jgi:hypothetical protein
MPSPSQPPRGRPMLDYQKPITRGRGDSTNVAAIMLKREARFRASWTTLTIAGAIVAVIGCALPATFIWLISLRFRRFDDPLPWTSVYWWTVFIGVPVAFLLEHMTRGRMLNDAYEDIDYSSGFELNVRGRAMFFMFILDSALWGPRMVMAGTKRLRGRKAHVHADRDLAARLLATLYQREEGMNTGDLFAAAASGASDDAFGDALAYLAFFDWIAIGKNGTRVWLLSNPRKRLDRG